MLCAFLSYKMSVQRQCNDIHTVITK